jgi:hypothetical protein
MQNPQYNVKSKTEIVNSYLPIRYFEKLSMNLQYATTYDW